MRVSFPGVAKYSFHNSIDLIMAPKSDEAQSSLTIHRSSYCINTSVMDMMLECCIMRSNRTEKEANEGERDEQGCARRVIGYIHFVL